MTKFYKFIYLKWHIIQLNESLINMEKVKIEVNKPDKKESYISYICTICSITNNKLTFLLLILLLITFFFVKIIINII